MDAAEFDKFADEYYATHKDNIRASGEDPEFFAEYKVREVAADLSRAQVEPPRTVLDLGGGVGASTVHLRNAFPAARLILADVSRRSLEIAGGRGVPGLEIAHLDGETLPFRDGEIDLVFVACVFHHVDHDRHAGMLNEIRRVLAPEGRFYLFEHNPWNPLTRKAVWECPFDENAVLISGRTMLDRVRKAGFGAARVSYRVFFPRALRSLRRFEPLLGFAPIGAQYFIAAR
ncbi:MAG: methyltransferase domain-containing protein [Alphaproteobacteria bacterium]|nr:methyltransferase domain-containing protein [Alphaproteobacteria bacterium]